MDTTDLTEIAPVRATTSDAEQVARVLAIAWGKAPDNPQVHINAAKLKEEFQQIDPTDRQVYKAIRDGEVVGFARIRKSSDDPETWWFAGLAVHPSCRRRGVASALLHRCTEHAKSQGAKRVWSWSHSDNQESLGWHRSVGFTEEEESTAEDGDRKVRFSLSLAGDHEPFQSGRSRSVRRLSAA